MHLSSEMIDRSGLYMMDAGTDIYFYMSKGINLNLCKELFGLYYDEITSGKWRPLKSSSPYTNSVSAFVKKNLVKEDIYPTIWVMRETDVASKAAFLSCCIEDKMGEMWSYPQFLTYLREQVSK